MSKCLLIDIHSPFPYDIFLLKATNYWNIFVMLLFCWTGIKYWQELSNSEFWSPYCTSTSSCLVQFALLSEQATHTWVHCCKILFLSWKLSTKDNLPLCVTANEFQFYICRWVDYARFIGLQKAPEEEKVLSE